jgi:SAM-dependent methyltransferase
MGVSARHRDPHDAEGTPEPAKVVWHDLECGGYRADLPLWRALADAAIPHPGAQPVLDIGAGTGRVALDLAAHGHSVTALDQDRDLLAALTRRADAAAVETVCADARTLQLSRHDFALALVPMQTIQLLGGGAGRSAFLARARAHLRPGGLLACAIVTALEQFDCAAGDPAPAGERARVGELVYESRPRSVRLRSGTIQIERERVIHAPHGAGASAGEIDAITLDRLPAARLRREGERAGFTAAGTVEIPPTEDHVGSAVVMLRA